MQAGRRAGRWARRRGSRQAGTHLDLADEGGLAEGGGAGVLPLTTKCLHLHTLGSTVLQGTRHTVGQGWGSWEVGVDGLSTQKGAGSGTGAGGWVVWTQVWWPALALAGEWHGTRAADHTRGHAGAEGQVQRPLMA